jgi:hypothetical protein
VMSNPNASGNTAEFSWRLITHCVVSWTTKFNDVVQSGTRLAMANKQINKSTNQQARKKCTITMKVPINSK